MKNNGKTEFSITIKINSGGVQGPVDNIAIKGYSSDGLAFNPLIVVDGVIYSQYDEENNSMHLLNPDDFESITVLKYAASIAKYGE